MDAPRKHSAVLCAGRVDCCLQAALGCSISQYTLLVKIYFLFNFFVTSFCCTQLASRECSGGEGNSLTGLC